MDRNGKDTKGERDRGRLSRTRTPSSESTPNKLAAQRSDAKKKPEVDAVRAHGGQRESSSAGEALRARLGDRRYSQYRKQYGPAIDVNRLGNRRAAQERTQRQANAGPLLRRKVARGGSPSPRAVKAAQRDTSRGSPLPAASAAKMGASFGRDLSDVRVHSDASANKLSAGLRAQAFTRGKDVYFASGKFAPGTQEGDRLLAHEVAHTQQPSRGQSGLSRGEDRAEAEANRAAERVTAGGQATPLQSPPSHELAYAAQQTESLLRASWNDNQSLQYVGADHSISSEEAQALSDDQLRASASGTRRELSLGSASAEDNRAIVLSEMARRGIPEAPPSRHGAELVVQGLVWATDPSYVRWMVEALVGGVMGSGVQAAQEDLHAHIRSLRLTAGYSPVAGVPEQGTVPPERDAEIRLAEDILAVVETQTNLVEEEQRRFIQQFEADALRLGLSVLAESERKIRSELERYGIVRSETQEWECDDFQMGGRSTCRQESTVGYGYSEDAAATGERDNMMTAAGEIADSEEHLREIRTREFSVALLLDEQQHIGEDDDDMDAAVDSGPVSVLTQVAPLDASALQQLQDLHAALQRQVRTTTQEHALLRAQKESEFAILAAYTSGETVDLVGLRRMATAPSAAGIGRDAYQKLANIEQVRSALHDDLSIFEIPQLLDLARAQAHVAPGTPRDAAIRARLASIGNTSMWRTIGILVVSIGLGLLAAIPTAGASLGVTAMVVGAEVAGLALDVYLLHDSLNDYSIQSAMTNTDFDRARSLSQTEPSLFWLAVDLVGTAVGFAGALSTFRKVARVRRAALAARQADEVMQQLAELRRFRDMGEITGDAARRLEREILSQHPDRTIAALLGTSGAALQSADDIARGMGRTLNDVVAADDIGRLSRELGLPVVRSIDLSEEVHVLFHIVDRRRVRVDRIAIGAASTIGDVLAHRETVTLMRLMETTTESLGHTLDELLLSTIDGVGAVNPFPRGSQAFNSWFELRKYPEIIQQRLAHLGTDGVSRAGRESLRDDLRFFQTELAHHQDIVRRVVLESGDDFVARAARTNNDAFAAGYPRVIDLDGRRFPLGESGSQYYYARHGQETPPRYVLRRYIDAVDAPAAAIFRNSDGTFRLTEGVLTRAESGQALVHSWPQHLQDAFGNAQRAAATRLGDRLFRVVPLAGLGRTSTTIGAELSGSGASVLANIQDTLRRGLLASHGAREAARLARRAVADLAAHPITVVRGTDQLRAFSYGNHFRTASGQVVNGDLHHLIPLYLGGNHRIANLLDLDPRAHRELHRLIESIEIGGTTLGPNQIGRLDLNFEQGVAILLRDGTVELRPLSEFLMSSASTTVP